MALRTINEGILVWYSHSGCFRSSSFEGELFNLFIQVIGNGLI